MSIPTKQEEEETAIEEKPDRPWWHWFCIEIPAKPQQRVEFFGLILMIITAESLLGFTIGLFIRSAIGWPF